MIATTDPLTAARATALFVSDLPATRHLSRTEVEAAIRHALRTHGGTRGCAADMAATYGDYPDLAAPRMRWARHVVGNLYQTRLRPSTQATTKPVESYRMPTPHGMALAA